MTPAVGQEPHASLEPGECSSVIQQEKLCKRYLSEEVPSVGHVLWRAISYGSHIPQGLCSVGAVFPIKPCPKAAIFCGSHAVGLSFPVSLARPEGKGLLAT